MWILWILQLDFESKKEQLPILIGAVVEAILFVSISTSHVNHWKSLSSRKGKVSRWEFFSRVQDPLRKKQPLLQTLLWTRVSYFFRTSQISSIIVGYYYSEVKWFIQKLLLLYRAVELPTCKHGRLRVWPGLSYPLGASWDGAGVNFALFSESATKVEICLFAAVNDVSNDWIRVFRNIVLAL